MRRIISALWPALSLVSFTSEVGLAGQPWTLTRTWESQALTDSAFYLMAAADVNRNGTKELIAADLGRPIDLREGFNEIWDEKSHLKTSYHLFVLEWDGSQMHVRWRKDWDLAKLRSREERDSYFTGHEAHQLAVWRVGDDVIVETVPANLSLAREGQQYVLREQPGSEPPIVSWAFPWLSPGCYQGSSYRWKGLSQRECLLGIRDFSKAGLPKVVTVYEECIEGCSNDGADFEQRLRVRKLAPGFPIEWEMISPIRLRWWIPSTVDHLNGRASGGVLIPEHQTWVLNVIERSPDGKGYRLRPTSMKKGANDDTPTDIRGGQAGWTRSRGTEEYWGYTYVRGKSSDGGSVRILRRVTAKPDMTGFLKQDINFPVPEHFVGIGQFALRDVDGDGLDEVVWVEHTATKREFVEEQVYFEGVKDYVRILKWNGKTYQTMWVSPPYSEPGVRFLVDDVKKSGKNQLVVLTGHGTIQIWEKK